MYFGFGKRDTCPNLKIRSVLVSILFNVFEVQCSHGISNFQCDLIVFFVVLLYNIDCKNDKMTHGDNNFY